MLLVRNAMQVTGIYIHPEAALHEAAEMMIRHGVDVLPVMDGHRLVGVIRLADLLTAPIPMDVTPRASERRDEAQLLETWRVLPVRNIMNKQMLSVTEDTPLLKAAALMINNGRQRLPVLRAGKIVGMISRADVVRALLTAQKV